MTPTFLSEPNEALVFFREQGYHIEPNAWSAEEVEKVIAASEKLPSFMDGTHAPAMHPHLTDPVFLSALKNPRIVKIVEILVNGKVNGLQTQFFHGKPGTPGFSRHQDNSYVNAPPDAFASAWSPMVDVSAANGTLIVYPGSHREPILPVEMLKEDVGPAQDKNARLHQVAVPDKYKPFDIIAHAGDAVFLHSQVIHCSHTNRSSGYRRVLLSTYIRIGAPFRPGMYARRTPVDVYSQEMINAK